VPQTELFSSTGGATVNFSCDKRQRHTSALNFGLTLSNADREFVYE